MVSTSQNLPRDKYVSDWRRHEGTSTGSGNQEEHNMILLLFPAESRGSRKSTEIYGYLCAFRSFFPVSQVCCIFFFFFDFIHKQTLPIGWGGWYL